MSTKNNNDKTALKSVNELLSLYRIPESERQTTRITHTALPNYPTPGGSFHIPHDMMEEFLEAYARDVFENKQTIHLTEAHHSEVSPILIDLDFRQKIDDNPEVKKIYTQDDVKEYLEEYHKVLAQYIDKDELKAHEIAYVMEKSKAYRGKGAKSEEIKDGIHVVYPKLCPHYKIQFLARYDMVESDVVKKIFNRIKTTNTPRNVIDHAVIRNNNWFMYGSCKPESEPYKITHIYDVGSGKCVDIDLKTELKNTPKHHLNLLKKLSISYKKTLTETKSGIEDSVKEKYDNMPTEDKDNSERKTNKSGHITQTKPINMDSRKLNMNKIDDKDFELAQRLAKECLSGKRATYYEDWVRVCWCLSNIDYRLEDAFIEFSRKAPPSKFDEIGCRNEWARSQVRVMESLLGIGTLHKWAIEDNKSKYNEICRDSLSRLMYISMNKTHTDIANYIYEKYKHEFKCSSIAHSKWYHYKNHRWVPNERGNGLKRRIGDKVARDYAEYSTYCNNKSGEFREDEPEKDNWQSRSKTAGELSLKLRNTAFCNSVFTQCQELFFDEEFENALDSNDNLLHFLNGVYDLDNNEFREGYPEDNISLTTGINFIEQPDLEDQEKLAQVEDFFNKIFPHEDVRKYVVNLLSSFLHGANKDQKFHIWTGGGGNGKSMLIDLFKKTLGNYCGSMSSTVLTQGRGGSENASPALASTRGKRFISLDEAEVGAEIQVGFMRQLTGGDEITARHLNCAPITFRPKFKLVLTCNEMPSIPSNEDATWRRIRVVKFISRFCDNPKKQFEFMIDRELQNKMNEWREVFMYMLIQYFKNSYKPNGISEPEAVLVATNATKITNDYYGQFAEEFLREDVNSTIGIEDIFSRFRAFLNSAGVNSTKYTRKGFENSMNKILGKCNTRKKWKGWKLIDPKDEDDDDDS
jgi:P4 family phage/plasmid primase-like protien